jgi:hypothetical protein
LGNCLIAGSRASCLGGIGNLVELSTLGKNSGLLVPLLLIKLLTLAELAALVGKLLFIGALAGLALALLALKIGLVLTEGLAEFVVPVVAKPIFIDGLALLVLLNYLAKSPFVEFSSLRLSQAIVYKESTSFFLGI